MKSSLKKSQNSVHLFITCSLQMIQFLKVSLIILTVIILLITSFIGYLIQFSDHSIYKPLITRWVKEKTQRELKFDGDIKFTFSPRLGLEINLTQLFFSEYQSDKAFATAEHIYVSFFVQPLLRKQLVINEMAIQGLKGRLIRTADGHMNIDDLITTDNESLQLKFNMDHVHVENAALFFHDAVNKRHYALSKLNLATDNITNESLDNLKLVAKGKTANFAENDAYGFKVNLDLPNLLFGDKHIESRTVNLIAKVAHQKNWLKGKFTLSNISSTGSQFQSDMLTIELVTEKEAQIAKLHLSSPVAGNLTTRKLNLPNMRTTLSLSTPDFPDQPLSGMLQGNLTVAGLSKNIQANLAGNFEDSHIEAKFDMRGFKKPVFNMVIDIDQLSMDQLLRESYKKALKINQIKTKQPLNTSPNEPLDLSLLKDLNVNGLVRIGALRSGNLTLSDIQIEVLSDNSSSIADSMR